ncbi:MAG: MlaA family lipoprotein [Alphaproteobacteria bacterium]
MGKHNQLDRLGFCLIGLVMGALVATAPHAARAQETDESPSAAEDSAPGGPAETEDGETGDGEPAPEEEADAAADGEAAPAGEAPSAGTAPEAVSTPEGEETEPLPGDDGDPANAVPAPLPARAREPVTGADEPYEPGEGYGLAEDGEAELDAEDDEIDTGDPLEGMNRAFFEFNDFLDKLLLKPTAQLYRFILPDYVQDRVRNVVNNADTPVILANDILQWKWDRAWNTTSRFFINTTLGVGGIWDVASSFGIERHDEDFGQTLCVWGVNEWVYLYLPFVGPTSPRDLTGEIVDRFFDPLSYYADVVQQVDLSDGVTIRWNVDTAGLAQLSLTAADLIDMRARNIETINEIERTSIDFYTAVRSLYRQSRENACNDGQVEFEDLPELDEFE